MTTANTKHELGKLFRIHLRNVAADFDKGVITQEQALYQASKKALKKLSKRVSNVEQISDEDLKAIMNNYTLLMVNHVMGIEKIK